MTTLFFWYGKCWRQYADFSSRAGRSEYWYLSLVNFLVGVAFAIPLWVSLAVNGSQSALALMDDPLIRILNLISGLYSLAAFIPSLAVCVRRLHDIGRSGWWLLIGLVPLVGAVVLLVFACTDSDPGTNSYGPKPPSLAELEANAA